VDAEHGGAEDGAAVLFVELGPDHQIGDAGLVFQGDKHHALGRARFLADQDDAGDADELQVPGGSGQSAGLVALTRQLRAQEGQGVVPQRKADVAIVLDHLAAGGHRLERDLGLVGLGDDPPLAQGGSREQRERLVP
jgi:hypothetical protein